uniref:Uncharacterized protein n=1 Tax=Wolbachia endosymbiont of Aleurodicus dispersus TaxID=1288877 RepID=A0A3B0JEI6_9RICK
MSNKPKEEFYDIAIRESSSLIGEIKEHPC